MTVISINNRKQLEVIQGNQIKDSAEHVWGWGSSAGKIRVKRRVDEILKRLNNLDSPSVLEIGAGVGIFTEHFIQKNLNLVSLDISYELIRLAKEKKGLCKILVGDAELMPFNSESFECVIGISVLHHLNIKNALKEIYRVLKSKGRIIFSEPNMANPQVFLQKRISCFRRLMHETPTETAFLRKKMEAILRENGFTSVSIIPFDFLHPATPKFLIEQIEKIGVSLEKMPFVREISGSLLIYAEKK